MKRVGKSEGLQNLVKGETRFPGDSFLYGKAIPILLVGFVLLTSLLILIAAGILLGVIPYQ